MHMHSTDLKEYARIPFHETVHTCINKSIKYYNHLIPTYRGNWMQVYFVGIFSSTT
jgi:hypothetical protein